MNDAMKYRYMKSTESGYKSLMLKIHDVAPPIIRPKGNIAFNAKDICLPQKKWTTKKSKSFELAKKDSKFDVKSMDKGIKTRKLQSLFM